MAEETKKQDVTAEKEWDPIPDDPGQARRWAASEAMKLGGRLAAPVTEPIASVVSDVAGEVEAGATELEKRPETIDIGAMLRSITGR